MFKVELTCVSFELISARLALLLKENPVSIRLAETLPDFKDFILYSWEAKFGVIAMFLTYVYPNLQVTRTSGSTPVCIKNSFPYYSIGPAPENRFVILL